VFISTGKKYITTRELVELPVSEYYPVSLQLLLRIEQALALKAILQPLDLLTSFRFVLELPHDYQLSQHQLHLCLCKRVKLHWPDCACLLIFSYTKLTNHGQSKPVVFC